MFFSDRIKTIQPGDYVLEVGPGATPHPKASIFLEREFDTEELIAQSGHVGILKTDKPIVYYDGTKFPFKDKEFDYVICSHVLEHVDDVPSFLSEIFRVGKKGYLEFPTIYYDYLHNIEEHLNLLLYKDQKIFWCKKTETPIPNLTPFTNFFRELQYKGFRFQDDINALWHQGFEWEEDVPNVKTTDWMKLTYEPNVLKTMIPTVSNQPKPSKYHGVKFATKQLFKEVLHRLKLRS